MACILCRLPVKHVQTMICSVRRTSQLSDNWRKELFICYKIVSEKPEYWRTTFRSRRSFKMQEISEPTESSTKWMSFTVADYIDSIREVVEGRMDFFHDFHKVSSLTNVLKLLLHGSPDTVHWAASEPVLVALFNLSGAVMLDANDLHLFILLDHLVLLRERKGMKIDALTENLYGECCRRAFVWPLEKIVKVIDIFIRLREPDFDAVCDLVDVAWSKLAVTPTEEISNCVLFVLIYFGNFSKKETVTDNILNTVERRMKKRIWKLSLEELAIILSYFVLNSKRIKTAELKRKIIKILSIQHRSTTENLAFSFLRTVDWDSR